MDLRQIYELAAEFIAKLGFPIFIALWLMVRDWRIMSGILKALNDHTHAIDRNTIMLDALIAALDEKTRPNALYRATESVTDEIEGFRVQE